MAIMVAGVVLVAALVVWALTRTVEPAAEPAATFETATAPATTPEPAAPATEPAATTATTATAAPPARPQGDPSTVQRMAVEDLRAKLNRNEVTVIDVRDAASFNSRHIPGAINVPFASVEAMLDQIPKDKPIVTYCT